jgi:putative hydrolase of HD superfamily
MDSKMEHAKRILDFLKFSEKLKTQKRDNLLSDGKYESVADHSWHLALMAFLVYPHLEYKVDLLKTLKMILVHDLTEAEIGDLPFSHSIKNPDLKKSKDIKEKQEIQKIKDMVGGELGGEVFELWNEYKQRISNEARFVKALDSLEADYQALLFGDINYWDDIYYDIVLSKNDKNCKHEKILQELNQEIKKRTEPEMTKIGLDIEKIRKSLK